MDFEQLRYFRAAARHQHMGRAAEELGISQSALSRSIARFEKNYPMPLFDRHGRNIRLNTHGMILLSFVERAMRELENGERELLELANVADQQISIGFLGTLGMQLVPDLVNGFKTEHDEAQFRLLQGSMVTLHEHLVAGQLDLCLSAPRFIDSAIEWTPLWDEELIAVVPPKHRLAKQKQIRLEDLAMEPMVALTVGTGLRQDVDEITRRAGFVPRIVFEGGGVSTIIGLVGAGVGVALVPRGAELRLGIAVPVRIKSPRCVRTVGLSWMKERHLNRLAQLFRDFVIRQKADLGDPTAD